MTTTDDDPKHGGPSARPVFAPTPGRRRPKRAVHLGKAVSGLLDPAARKHGFASAELLARWPEIAGPEIAAVTRPVKLARSGQGRPATLHLTVRLGHLLDLTYETDRLISRINDYLGGAVIGRVVCQEGDLPADPPPPVTAPLAAPTADLDTRLRRISDPELRRALATLGGYRLDQGAETSPPDKAEDDLPDL